MIEIIIRKKCMSSIWRIISELKEKWLKSYDGFKNKAVEAYWKQANIQKSN